MTRKELHGTFPKLSKVCETPEYRGLLETAREECPFLSSAATDPTSIIQNEGKIKGWNECLRFLKDIWKATPEREKVAAPGLYRDPDPPRNSDTNKK